MTIETELAYSNRENKSIFKRQWQLICKVQLAAETNYIPRLSVCSRMNVCVQQCVCLYVSQIHEEFLSFQATFLQTP